MKIPYDFLNIFFITIKLFLNINKQIYATDYADFAGK